MASDGPRYAIIALFATIASLVLLEAADGEAVALLVVLAVLYALLTTAGTGEAGPETRGTCSRCGKMVPDGTRRCADCSVVRGWRK